MDNNLSLEPIRQLPKWTIIPFSLGLALLAVVLGLVLEPAADALSPDMLTPVPTMPAIAYGEGRSETCHDCHFSLSALEASATDPATAQAYLIEEESLTTPHGRLGCIACHGGDGEAEEKAVAHENLVADMSAQDPEKCVICHQDLPDQFPDDQLQVPHGRIIEGIQQGEPCDVHCSDCHGAVGHGFDPISGEKICSMTVCVDCHQERDLEVQMADCDACHLGPHDVSASLTCNDCHTSTEVWHEVELGVHPMPLDGKHGEIGCFACHEYPDFKGLNNICTDCHESVHTDERSEAQCEECHDPGTSWTALSAPWDGHAELWDQYKGVHASLSCKSCHSEGDTDLDPNCDSCHEVPESHEGGRDQVECTQCHQADQPWQK